MKPISYAVRTIGGIGRAELLRSPAGLMRLEFQGGKKGLLRGLPRGAPVASDVRLFRRLLAKLTAFGRGRRVAFDE